MQTNTQHDFKPAIEKTSTELARIILQNYNDNVKLFVYEDNAETRSPEYVANIEEQTIDFGIRTMALMAATDIPADYATYGIDKIIAGFTALKAFIDGSLRQNRDEILSRTVGAKSPETNTYAYDCATLGDVMVALKKIRDEQGNNPDDYFIKKAAPETAELSTPEVDVPKTE